MSGSKMKVESISAWGNYHCSSMCQAWTARGWGVIMGLAVERDRGPHRTRVEVT